MKSTIISLCQCSNNHTVISLLANESSTSNKFFGKPVYKAYVDKTEDADIVGKEVEHSRPFKGWVTIKDINALRDNK